MFCFLLCTLYFLQGGKEKETNGADVRRWGICLYVIREKCLTCLITSFLFLLKWPSFWLDFWPSQWPILPLMGWTLGLYPCLSPGVQRKCDFVHLWCWGSSHLPSLRNEGNVLCLLFTFDIFVHVRHTERDRSSWASIWDADQWTTPREMLSGTPLVVQWLRLHTPNAGTLGSIPGQGTRSHML